MDPHQRSQSVLHVRPVTASTVSSRASRILQKVTGRIRLYPNRKPAPLVKDDNHPYPSQAPSRSSMAGLKPYMSHPMLNSTFEPYVPGDDPDSPSPSGSPPGSYLRRSGDLSPVTPTSFTNLTNTHTIKAIDGLPVSFAHDAPPVWKTIDTPKAPARPQRPTRPPPEIPVPTKHRPPAPISDASEAIAKSSFKEPTEQTGEISMGTKQTKVETPSTFSPARLFARKASRPNLKDSINGDTPPPVPSKHRQTPSIVIDPPPEVLPPSPPPQPGAKRPKVARIDTGLSPARLFTRKASRTQLQEPSTKRTSDDPPTPYDQGQQRHPNHPPTPPPPLPKPFATRSTTPTPVALGTSSSASSASSSSTSSYHTSFSNTTNNTTPASTSASTHNPPPTPPKLSITTSSPAVPQHTTPIPPILQRSETGPRRSYRLSLQLSTVGLRAPLNLPTLPSISPVVPPSPSRRARVGLRDMPELSHDGEREEPDDDDDADIDIDIEMDEDEDGRLSRSSGRTTPYRDEDEDGYRRPRPSFSSSIGSSIDTSSSSLGTSIRHGKTHSRSSSYNHFHDYSLPIQDPSAEASPPSINADFLQLPTLDTPRLDLDLDFSFLDRPPTPSQSQKDKNKCREDEEGGSGGKTPTSSTPYPNRSPGGGYFSEKSPKHNLKLLTGPDALGVGIAGLNSKGKGKEREMDTAKPIPPPMQASVSMGPGLGITLGNKTGGGIYASKRASRSLVDLGALERREKVEEIVRSEEVKLERRRSRMHRMSRIDGSLSGDVGGAAVKQEEVQGQKARTDVATSKATEIGSANAEATSMDTVTPLVNGNKRISMAPAYDTLVRRTSTIHRRRSMPTFTEATEPPPYPSFPPLSPSDFPGPSMFSNPGGGSGIQPRDDEGRERLPPYSNDIYMRAILPRKMEFTRPGAQAKDRKWRKVVCVLEGTALKVYKAPRERGKAALGDWWERRVGVPDKTVPYIAPSKPKKEDIINSGETVPKLVGEGADDQTELILREPPTPVTPITPARAHPSLSGEHPYIPGQERSIYGHPQPQANRSRINLAVSSLLRPSSSKTHIRANSDATHPNPGFSSSNSPRPSLNLPRPGTAHSGRGSFSSSGRPGTPSDYSHALPSSASSMRSQSSSAACTVDDPRDLLRVYTMQNAESGLGNDYIKRKNVIRVRTEGEQFLLQAKDVEDVVAWIEVLQASANVALDLDERLMPKGPLFPRRRRRRGRAAAASTTSTNTNAAATTRTGTSAAATTNTAGQSTSLSYAAQVSFSTAAL